jgi:putative endonuclease
MSRDRRANHQVGRLGEQLVSQWLETQGWTALDRRWYTRWGEIDVIAQAKSSDLLAFVEIKTRGRGNWDEDGILSITLQKQSKLCHAAGLFLSEHPDFAEYACRFDVALVSHQKTTALPDGRSIVLGEPVILENYQLILHDYIEAAFYC